MNEQWPDEENTCLECGGHAEWKDGTENQPALHRQHMPPDKEHPWADKSCTRRRRVGSMNETVVNLAEAIKRILAADEGQLSERLEVLLKGCEYLTTDGREVFNALCGASLEELLERLK